jgi:glutaminase
MGVRQFCGLAVTPLAIIDGGTGRRPPQPPRKGLPFNSVMAIELNADRTMNPLVNAGAIATTSLVPGTTADEKFENIVAGMSRFAGRRLVMDDDVYESEAATNDRNRGIAHRITRYLSEALGLNLFASTPTA